jgi:hypothetical protein
MDIALGVGRQLVVDTCVTPLTSMPREARSVATSTRARPRLKLSSAFWRAFCDLLPWIASETTPRSSSASATRLAPRLVRVKTMTRSERLVGQQDG